MKAILFIILLAVSELALVFGVFGCGGAPFVLLDALNAQPEAEAPLDAFHFQHPDAALPEASPFEAAPPEASPHEAEAGVEAEAGAPEAATDASACTPIAPYAFACGANLATTTAPSEFCLSIAGQGSSSSMPPECRCKGTYTCACLMLAIPDPCRGRGFVGCGLGNGPALRVECR